MKTPNFDINRKFGVKTSEIPDYDPENFNGWFEIISLFQKKVRYGIAMDLILEDSLYFFKEEKLTQIILSKRTLEEIQTYSSY